MKKARLRNGNSEETPIAVAVAAVFGAGAFYCAEIIYGNVRDTRQIQEWRAHWASACVGTLVFVTALFLLESLGRKSKAVAIRSALLWLPIVALTAVATAVHISIYVIVVVAAVYSPWAYLRTRANR